MYATKGCKPNEHKWSKIWADMNIYQCMKCSIILSKAEIDKLLNQGCNKNDRM